MEGGKLGFLSVLLADLTTTHYAFIGAVLVGLLGVIFVLWVTLRAGSNKQEEEGRRESVGEEKDEEEEVQKQKKQQPKLRNVKFKPSKKPTLPSHPLLAADFKGHTGSVLSLDFDSSDRYLASSSEDRTVRLWFMKTLTDNEHKFSRKNIDFDYVNHIKFSPDGTAVVTYLAGANTLSVLRIAKQKGGSLSWLDSTVEFPQVSPTGVISIGIASTGKFIMTCTEKAFAIWSLRGDLLSTIDTHQAPNSCAAISPCGKFVACAGFTPDVKLWEIQFTKTGDFEQVSRAMELKGHRAAVLSLSFSGDSHRMATLSKDGTWKFWDIDVRYQLREDPRLLRSGELAVQVAASSLCALSPDARVVAVAITTSIYLYSTSSGELMNTLSNVHGDVITSLAWEQSSLHLASAGGTDRHIRLWRNAPGQKDLVRELQARIPKATSEPLKRRLEQQIVEAEERLKSWGQI